MVNTNDIYRKIKEMSKLMTNPRPQIMISSLAEELSMVREQILPSLVELKDMRLIQFDSSFASVKLTLLGHTVTR